MNSKDKGGVEPSFLHPREAELTLRHPEMLAADDFGWIHKNAKYHPKLQEQLYQTSERLVRNTRPIGNTLLASVPSRYSCCYENSGPELYIVDDPAVRELYNNMTAHTETTPEHLGREFGFGSLITGGAISAESFLPNPTSYIAMTAFSAVALGAVRLTARGIQHNKQADGYTQLLAEWGKHPLQIMHIPTQTTLTWNELPKELQSLLETELVRNGGHSKEVHHSFSHWNDKPHTYGNNGLLSPSSLIRTELALAGDEADSAWNEYIRADAEFLSTTQATIAALEQVATNATSARKLRLTQPAGLKAAKDQLAYLRKQQQARSMTVLLRVAERIAGKDLRTMTTKLGHYRYGNEQYIDTVDTVTTHAAHYTHTLAAAFNLGQGYRAAKELLEYTDSLIEHLHHLTWPQDTTDKQEEVLQKLIDRFAASSRRLGLGSSAINNAITSATLLASQTGISHHTDELQ